MGTVPQHCTRDHNCPQNQAGASPLCFCGRSESSSHLQRFPAEETAPERKRGTKLIFVPICAKEGPPSLSQGTHRARVVYRDRRRAQIRLMMCEYGPCHQPSGSSSGAVLPLPAPPGNIWPCLETFLVSRCRGVGPGLWWVEARMLPSILQHTGWSPKQRSDPDVHSAQVEKPVLTFRGCRLNSALVVGMGLAPLMWIKRGCPCLSGRGFPAPRAAGSLVESEKAGTLIKAVFFFQEITLSAQSVPLRTAPVHTPAVVSVLGIP